MYGKTISPAILLFFLFTVCPQLNYLPFLLQRIRALLASDKVRHIDMLRLVMLYALRYESHSNNDLAGLVVALGQRGVSAEHRAVRSFSPFLSFFFLVNRESCEIILVILNVRIDTWRHSEKSRYSHSYILLSLPCVTADSGMLVNYPILRIILW